MTYPTQRTDSPRTYSRPAAPPYPEDPTTATRHLCAGAYLDDAFRNECLRQVYYQPRRVVAPSFGFDAVPVLSHCLRARNAAMVRDSAILGTVLVAAIASPASLLLVLSSMATLQATIATYRLARDMMRKLRNGESLPLGALVPRVLLLVLGWTLASVVGAFASTSLVSQAMGSLGQGGIAGADTALTAMAVGSLFLALLIFLYPVGFSLWRQTELSRMAPGSRVTQPVRNPRLDEIARQQRGNTTVYSGYNQYVGSGDIVETWGFAQRLVRAVRPLAREVDGIRAAFSTGATPTEREREFAQPPFDAQELVDYVRAHLSMLLPHRQAEEQIAGLTVEDRICLSGTEVGQLLPHTPPEVMAAVVRHPTTPARHYLACQVFSWGGELITTVHVHIAVQGRSLYLELTTTALPPCDERFRIVDTVEGHSSVAWLRAVTTGLADTPRMIWRSPANLAAALINLVAGADSGPAEEARLTRGYDYGARVGIRELGREPEMRLLTQLQDVAKYQKLIERRVIASVLDFLDDREIDTAEYRARAASILNVDGGVHNWGGTVTNNGPVAGRDVHAGGNA
ncbi:hypothetical protein [Couchioplanes azureus]|uniref:hypothetical protein n=1 Tax=Couchioplanes caeruleus TaxID=56438 RepID=UPI0016713DDB|nr:hypothetical protein [Couchioplanes caeruleus]GGQ85479.1 hypothetical protein GCM10010166_64780 [Couchioplanes caeruleus subsp. azureus]